MYARLAERLASEPEVAGSVVGDEATWHDVLRLFGAVHYLVLTGEAPEALSGDWRDFAAALDLHAADIRRRMHERGVQTNEVKRCTALLPVFLAASQEAGLPLELIELGTSAGLNLLVDRYRYRFANGEWGRAAAALELVSEERGEVPAELLARDLDIRSRRGIDLAPIDATTREGYLLLRSFLWPGIEDRVARLDGAVGTLCQLPDPPQLVEGDYVRLLPDQLRQRSADALTVVFETFSAMYLPAESAAALDAALESAAADGRPLAWVTTRVPEDADGDTALELRVWPEPSRLAAYVDPHGNWLDWRL